MNKIVVKHSCIEINNYNLGDCPKLENIFSIYDQITHTSYFKGVFYDEENKILKLPRGIDIYYLEGLFGVDAKLDSKCDPFDKVGEIKIKYLPRDEEQKSALRFMVGEGSKYMYTKDKSQLCVNLFTGKGKTYCSVTTMAIFQMRSMVITSSINWINQWKDCILEYTDIKPREIYTIVGSSSIHTLLKRNNISKYKVILASHATIKSYASSYGWDKVTELFNELRIGLKFYDEAHLDFQNICNIDSNTNTYKTYYVTATPCRSSEEENRIYQLSFKNVPSIDLFDPNKDPHTKYISMRFKSNPTPQQISECRNAYGLDRNKYTNYIVKQENYYKLLRIILNMALKMEGKILMYIGTNNAIQITLGWILENYPELINDVGVYTSTISAEIKDIQLEKKIILSTTKSCGEALDIQGLKMTVVLAEPFKSERLAIQTLGRTRDKDTVYIEVVDMSFHYINKYYYAKKPIYAKYAISCTEINIKQDELDRKSDQIIIERNSMFMYYNPIQRVDCRLVEPIKRINLTELISPISRIGISMM